MLGIDEVPVPGKPYDGWRCVCDDGCVGVGSGVTARPPADPGLTLGRYGVWFAPGGTAAPPGAGVWGVLDLAGVACPLPPNSQSGATPASRLATSPGPPLSTLPFRSLSMRACSRCRSRSSSPSSASLKIFPIALRGLLMIEPAPPPGLPLASPPPPPRVRWMNRLVSSAIVAVLGSFNATAVSSPGCDGVDGRFCCCRERDLGGCAVGVRGGVVEWTRPTYSSFSSSAEAPSSWIAFSTFL